MNMVKIKAVNAVVSRDTDLTHSKWLGQRSKVP